MAKKAAKADFRPNRADSGPPFGPTFGQILPFFEGLHFTQILGSKFRGVGGRIWPPVLCRLGRLGMRMEFHHALLLLRSAANPMGFALCRRPPPQTASFIWLMLFGLFRPFDIGGNVGMSEIVRYLT